MRELLTFRDFKGLLLDIPHASLTGTGKTGRATNFRVKDGSLVGLLTEEGDSFDLENAVTYTHSVSGAGRTLGRITGATLVEDGGTAPASAYLVVNGIGDGLGGNSGGLVAIPIGDRVAGMAGDLGSIASGYPLLESAPTFPRFLVSRDFLYVGGNSTLFRWDIGSQSAAGKTTHAAGANTGPPSSCILLGIYGARMFVRDGSNLMRIWFSDVENLTTGFVAATGMWPTSNFIDLPSIGRAEYVHSAVATPDGLAVFTNRSIRLIYDSDNGFNTVVDPEQGAFENSLQQQGDMIYGLNERGLFRTNGRLPAETLTDEAMGDWFSSNEINLDEAVASAIYDGSYWVTFTPSTGLPSGLANERLTIELNLTTGEIMWHGKPMDARHMVAVPSVSEPVPSQLICIRGDDAGAAGAGVGTLNAVAYAGLKGSIGMADETHACAATVPLLLEEREFRVQRVAVQGSDPSFPGVAGNTIGRFMAEDGNEPVGWWRLGETSGAAVDSIAARNGTVSGNPLRNQTGVLPGDANGCIDLDGTGDFITVPFAAALNPSEFTAAGWVRRDTDTGVRETILSSRGVAANYAARMAAQSGMVAHWRMVSVTASGSAANAISGSHTGTFGSTAALGASILFAEAGGSLNVAGSANGGMTVPYAAAINPANDFLFDVWVQPTTVTGTQVIYDCMNGNTGFQLRMVSGVLQLLFGTGAAVITVATSLTMVAGRRYHVGFLCDSGGGRIVYANGVQVGSSASAFSRNTAAVSRFGATVAGASPWSGHISEAAVHVPSINNPGTSADHYALGAYGSETGYAISINEDDKLELFIGGGTWGTVRVGATSIATGAWRHVALTFDEDGYPRVYLDGVLQITGSALTLSPNLTGALVMGQSPGGNYNTYLNGRLDEVAVWDRALTYTEVALLDDITDGAITWSDRALKVRLIDLHDPDWTGPTFTLRWRRGTWSVDQPTDRSFARVSGFRSRTLAVELVGYSGARIDRIDIEIAKLARRHP